MIGLFTVEMPYDNTVVDQKSDCGGDKYKLLFGGIVHHLDG